MSTEIPRSHCHGEQVLLDGAQRRLELVGDDGGEVLPHDLALPLESDGLQDEGSLLETPARDQAELFGRKRLGKKVVGALFHGVHRRAHGGVARDDDRHDGGVDGADLLEDLESGDARHLQVDEHEVRAIAFHELQADDAVVRGLELVVALAQDLGAGVQDDFLVVDDQDLALVVAHDDDTTSATVTGSRTVNVVPVPNSLWTETEPLCSLMIP
jgi:hypothetical protein